jgi:hypothetical protein
MIDFPCLCGFKFSVPADLAGGLIQCPQCKRLNDVPTLGEISNLDGEGIYKLEPSPQRHEPQRLGELFTAFTRQHFDAEGNPIDLRLTMQDVLRAGGEEVPLELRDQVRPGAPRYDPITGELIRPIEVKPDQSYVSPKAPIPTAQLAPKPPPKAIDGIDLPDPLELFRIPLRLLRPINLLVMFFMLLGHLIAQFMLAAIAAFYWILIPFWAVLHGVLIAHFGNVIDETGPTSRDELPAPLRSVSFQEDLFAPLVRIIAALVVCYGPALLLLLTATDLPSQVRWVLSGCLAGAGTVFFPAVVLTLMTSGSVLNLRPDRLVRVMFICGAEYLVAIITWAIGGPLYLAGALLVSAAGAGALNEDVRQWLALPSYIRWYVSWGVLAAGVYLLHLLCWHLGTLYRRHHFEFPWVFQRHIRQPRETPPGGFPLSQPAAAGPTRLPQATPAAQPAAVHPIDQPQSHIA